MGTLREIVIKYGNIRKRNLFYFHENKTRFYETTETAWIYLDLMIWFLFLFTYFWQYFWLFSTLIFSFWKVSISLNQPKAIYIALQEEIYWFSSRKWILLFYSILQYWIKLQSLLSQNVSFFWNNNSKLFQQLLRKYG